MKFFNIWSICVGLLIFSGCGKDQKEQKFFETLLQSEKEIISSIDNGKLREEELFAFGVELLSYWSKSKNRDEVLENLVNNSIDYFENFQQNTESLEPSFLAILPTLYSQQAFFLSQKNTADKNAKAAEIVTKAIRQFNALVKKYPNDLILRINRGSSYKNYPKNFNTRKIALQDFYLVSRMIQEQNLESRIDPIVQSSIYRMAIELMEDGVSLDDPTVTVSYFHRLLELSEKIIPKKESL